MSFNLSGSSFGDFNIGHSQQNAVGIMHTDLRAVLFVFRPYQNQFQDVGLRPFGYMFDTNFINDVEEVTATASRTELTSSALLQNMKSKVNFNDYIMPSRDAQLTFKASHLSYNHRFILIMTDDAKGLAMGNTMFSTGGNNKQRRIYTGFFTDEPFTRGMFGGKPVLNPDSTMVITHKTVVGMTATSSQWGYQEKLSTHMSDEIFNPSASLPLTSVNMGGHETEIHLMTPDNCLNTVDATVEGDTVILPGVSSDLNRWKANTQVSSILEQPDHNVTHIVRGMIKHVDEQNNRNIMLGRSTQASFDDRYVHEDLARISMRNNLMMPRANMTTSFDLDINASISPVDIDKIVNGTLEVVDINLERPDYYETMDQMEMSMTNQYSFLISSVVIPIISGAGLDSLQFSFEMANVRGQVLTDFRIGNPMANYPVSDQAMADMIRAVQFELENGIFKTIYDAVGDFGVTVSACVTGMTSVRLNLVGMGMTNPVDFEFPSCMGGLVSPLIGSAAAQSHNSHSVESLFNVAMGKNPNPGYFNDDDKGFMSLANSFQFDG